MKATCKFSGITFSTTYFGGLELRSRTEIAHPIFHIPKKQLWSRVSDFHQGASVEERKLLFIAVLASTELVSFRVPANPSDSIVNANFNRLVKIASWIDSIQHPAAQFPQFVISSDSADLTSLSKGWLTALEELQTDWIKAELNPRLFGEAKDAHIKKLRRAAALDRLIQKNSEKISTYSGLLASWIISTCSVADDEMVFSDRHEVEISMQQFITEIITCKDEDILSINIADLGYLAEYLLDRLPEEVLGTRQAWAALEACKKIQAKHEGTMTSLLEDYTIVTEDDELIALEELAPAPLAQNYATKLAFLTAKAEWNVKKAAHDRVASKEATNQIAEQEPAKGENRLGI